MHLKRGKMETALAKALWRKGYRYRLNDRKLPGSPDIAVLRYKIAVFVDGEFWHGRDWGVRKQKLKSNREYWIEKIEENMERDRRNDVLLEAMGWIPVHFWEKEVKKDLAGCVQEIEGACVQRRIDERLLSCPDGGEFGDGGDQIPLA